ncbi:MAG: response regulator transcription factor [Halobacteriovoraceae bacterium]|jgi:DNA-binding response OmpR family regulator|nr:response regulator transcription factor [Halobacteriovoraceae bacterium]MBT5094818.1 response regulator transcription factor [Halobacteriovoraceae bacterium]
MKELNTILVIEDDQDMASLVKNFLNSLYPAADTILNDEQTAFKTAKNFNIDLFIVDINLPTYSGYDLGQIMRSITGKDIPTLYISSNPDYHFEKGELGDDSSLFLKKPFGKEKLKEYIEKIISEA